MNEESKTYRVRIEPDPDPDTSWLEQPEFADEDPNDHELAEFLLEQKCPCCGTWKVVDALGSVDYLISKGGAPFGTVEIEVGPQYAPGGIEYRSTFHLDEYSQSIVSDMVGNARSLEPGS